MTDESITITVSLRAITERLNALEANQGAPTEVQPQLDEVERVIAAYERGDEVGAVPVTDGSLAERVVIAIRTERIARAQAERKLDAHHRADASEDVSPFMNEGNARQIAHTIKVAMDTYDRGHDPLAALTLRHPLDLSGRVAALASEALRLRADTGAAAAARIRAAADQYATDVEANPGAHNTDEASAYYAGISDAAAIAANETPEADPNVAHIDTVNGRQRPAQAPDTQETE